MGIPRRVYFMENPIETDDLLNVNVLMGCNWDKIGISNPMKL